jgi:hypothetical protein
MTWDLELRAGLIKRRSWAARRIGVRHIHPRMYSRSRLLIRYSPFASVVTMTVAQGCRWRSCHPTRINWAMNQTRLIKVCIVVLPMRRVGMMASLMWWEEVVDKTGKKLMRYSPLAFVVATYRRKRLLGPVCIGVTCAGEPRMGCWVLVCTGTMLDRQVKTGRECLWPVGRAGIELGNGVRDLLIGYLMMEWSSGIKGKWWRMIERDLIPRLGIGVEPVWKAVRGLLSG